MRVYVGQQEAISASEFDELAIGFDAEEQLPDFLLALVLGETGESATDRAVRLDAARGILADWADEAPDLVDYVAMLLGASPLAPRIIARRSAHIEAA